MINIQDADIFIIDDEKGLADTLADLLRMHGITNEIKTFTDPHKMLEQMNDKVKIAIVDYTLNSDLTGLELIKEIVKDYKQCLFIMLSGQDKMEVVVDFMNSTYMGCRYVEKAGRKWDELLLYYVKDFLDFISAINNVCRISEKLMEQNESLEKLIDNGIASANMA